MNRKRQRMELLMRFRRLTEDQRRNDMINILKRQNIAELGLSKIDEVLSRVDATQSAMLTQDTSINIARYLQLLDCGASVQEERRIQALKLESIGKLRHAKTQELASAWQDRRAAERRHEREQTLEQREMEKHRQHDRLDDWLARTEKK